MSAKLRLKARMIQNDSFHISCAVMLFAVLVLALISFLPAALDNFLGGEGFKLAAARTACAFLLMMICAAVWSSLSCGISRYFLLSAAGKKNKTAGLFYYFSPSKMAKAVKLGVLTALSKYALLVLFFSPFAVMAALAYKMLNEGASAAVLAIFCLCSAAMLICCAYFYLRVKRLLFLCRYLFIMNDSLTFRQLITASVRIMWRRTGGLFGIRLSFAGWFLLCIFLLPVPYVWSYYKQTMAVFAAKILTEKDTCDIIK